MLALREADIAKKKDEAALGLQRLHFHFGASNKRCSPLLEACRSSSRSTSRPSRNRGKKNSRSSRGFRLHGGFTGFYPDA